MLRNIKQTILTAIIIVIATTLIYTTIAFEGETSNYKLTGTITGGAGAGDTSTYRTVFLITDQPTNSGGTSANYKMDFGANMSFGITSLDYNISKINLDISGGKENSNNFILTHSASFKPGGLIFTQDRTGSLGFLETQGESCHCPFAGMNWEIKAEDNCTITYNCDIGTGIISFKGPGDININAEIKAAHMIPPPNATTIYLGPNALILINPNN